MSDEQKFANVPDDELEKYVEGSKQRPGESDENWRLRVQREEADLLAKHANTVKDKPPTFADAPLVSEDAAPTPTEGQPE